MRFASQSLIAAGILLAATTLYGQSPDESGPDDTGPVPGELESVTFRAGVAAAYGYNMHKTTSSVFSGGLDCGAFGDGTGSGFSVSGFFELPILEQILHLYGGLGYIDRGGSFGEVYVGGLPILDPNTDEYTTLERRHNYAATLGYLQTEFGVRYNVPWIPLYIRGAAGLGFGMTTTYEQTETIVSPEGVLYPETNTTERKVGSGDLQDVESLLTASGTIGYEFPLSDRMSIAPEISYYHPFSDITLNRDWKVSTIQGGASLRWNFGPVVQEPPAEPPPPLPPAEPTEPPPAPVPPTASVTIASPKRLSIVETVVTETFPILPYVFFDSAGTEIPRRYNLMRPGTVNTFDENSISWKSLEAYYNLLNILGKRMSEDETISVTVTGTTDGREASGAGAIGSLAQGRAESVQRYLVESWNIDPERIAVKTSNRPEYPSSEEYREGFEENRRVEIRPNDPAALRPIVHERFNEYSFTPDQIKLNLGAESTNYIRSWQLDVSAEGTPVMRRGGEGPPPGTIGLGIDQESAAKVAKGLSGKGAITATFSVKGSDGLTATEQGSIPTTVEVNPFEVSRLSLIVFDFDKSEITQSNRSMVKSFVADALKEGSTMTIVGSTDRLGDTAHNAVLSKQRAETVRDLILRDSPDVTITDVQGVGPRLRYDNSTPEGRYYCRTVTVEVKTPLKQDE